MKVLVISTSPRAKSNSDALADAFLRGALEAGHEATKITLRDKNIQFCRGCLACQRDEVRDMLLHGDSNKACVIRDDMAPIVQQMHDADIICFATPIYYYEMSGQMKTLLDRGNPLFSADYRFRDIFMLTASAEEGDSVASRAVSGLTGWIDCFANARLKGTLHAGGVTSEGDIANHPSLAKAYALGKNI